MIIRYTYRQAVTSIHDDSASLIVRTGNLGERYLHV